MAIAFIFNSVLAKAQAPVNVQIKTVPKIYFSGAVYNDYEVQATPDLGSPTWTNVARIVGNNTGIYSYIDDNAGGNRFYRVQSIGPTGEIVVGLNPVSQLYEIIKISQASQTDVLLARFVVKSRDIPGIMRSLAVQITVGGSVSNLTTLFSDIKIKVGSTVYSANVLAGNSALFQDIIIPLPADEFVSLDIYGKLNQNTGGSLNGATASVRLVVSGDTSGVQNNPEVENSAFQPISVNSDTVDAGTVLFTSDEGVLSNLSAALDGSVPGSGGTSISVSFQATVTAIDKILYVDKNANNVLGTATVGGISLTFATAGTVANPPTNPDDAENYFIVAPGQSRAFTFNGKVTNTDGTPGTKVAGITAFSFGIDRTNLVSQTISNGLEPLKVFPTF